jgi:hypothetical protein
MNVILRKLTQQTLARALSLAVLILFTIITAGTAQAATKTWDAGLNFTWDTTTANWTGSTFTQNDDAVFDATGVGTETLGENIGVSADERNNHEN